MNDRISFILDKIVNVEKAQLLCKGWRMKGEKIVFTNGCFDILHHGHLHYLAHAAQLGGRLIIGINSDSSVRGLNKSTQRPINNEESRAFLLAGMGVVDLVIVFEEQTPLNLIEKLLPDVLVKGGDYDERQDNKNNPLYIVGSDVVKKNGGAVQTIPLKEGFSTTEILNKLGG
ncbi:MAG: adenylyltransferase/cytidyltransferase family protein [Bacteroidetes bacterium]|nr:adenylyltransferase/cytidyltransferase family protein [Bacteroidota bacterium]